MFELGDRLEREDLPRIRALFAACTAFFELIRSDAVHDAEHIFDEVPAGKTAEDKLVFGITHGSSDRLDGLIELLRGYPGPDDWCVGLLLVSPAHRNHGIGGAAVDAMARYVCERGGRALHLIVQDQNDGALRFWRRHGFSILGKAPHGANVVYQLTRTLEPTVTHTY